MTQEEMIENLKRENEEIKKEREYYQELAQKDLMCEVFNKKAVEEKIKEQLSEVNNAYAILLIDVDDLKEINDTHGHIIGDKAILSIVDLLKKHFKSPCLIGRIGGDEFMVYVPSIKSRATFISLLNQLSKGMQENFVGDNSDIAAHCSIGAVITDTKQEFEELYQLADDTMYQVKNTTKSGYAICIK